MSDEMKERLEMAQKIIERGAELMTLDQLSKWEGYRGFIETEPDPDKELKESFRNLYAHMGKYSPEVAFDWAIQMNILLTEEKKKEHEKKGAREALDEAMQKAYHPTIGVAYIQIYKIKEIRTRYEEDK